MLGRRLKIGRRRRGRNGSTSYEKMMKTLLLQNQQIIIQQHNMMFMVIKQLQSNGATISSNLGSDSIPSTAQHSGSSSTNQHKCASSSIQHRQAGQETDMNSHRQQQSLHTDLNTQEQTSLNQHVVQGHILQPHQLLTSGHNTATTAANIDSHYHMQQVTSHIQETLGHYPTPASSEQDHICEKSEEDDLAALLDGDQLLHNNLLYNPQTDIGSITPYKTSTQPHQTPSYYSSGCESLTTPRLDQQRQPTTANINQNVVKNLADHFKSPTKPKINVQIVSGGSMKDSKAKIIQSMNISEFLRHVHPNSETQKTASQ